MAKKYTVEVPKKVRKEDLTGGGRCYYLTETVERILRNRMNKLEYWQKRGRSGLKKYPGTEDERLKFTEKLDQDLKDIKHLRGIFPRKEEK